MFVRGLIPTLISITIFPPSVCQCTTGEVYHRIDRLTGDDFMNYAGDLYKSEKMCALQCVSRNCRSFSVSQTVVGQYRCLFDYDFEVLPAGEWTRYSIPRSCSSEEGAVLFLQRRDGSVSFDRSWLDYQSGFGSPSTNLWLGLDNLHNQTTTTGAQFGLLATMTSWDDVNYWAAYERFAVGPEADGYRLSVAGYDVASTAGNSLYGYNGGDHNGREFFTADVDDGAGCASFYSAGWWFDHCLASLPTGIYQYKGTAYDNYLSGVDWISVPADGFISMKTFHMCLMPLVYDP